MPAQGPLRDGNPAVGLIETLRFEPSLGLVRRDRHLRRLRTSALALGLECDPHAVRQALDGAVAGAGEALRLRLFLPPEGAPAVTAQPFRPLAAGTVWTLRIAEHARLCSGDPLLRHKTDRRAAYEAARAEFSTAEANEVLLLNERGEICEGTITTVFADLGDGTLTTPPLASGLLEGVLRGELLEEGRAKEKVLTPQDLAHARALYVGNSLRGLVPARM